MIGIGNLYVGERKDDVTDDIALVDAGDDGDASLPDAGSQAPLRNCASLDAAAYKRNVEGIDCISSPSCCCCCRGALLAILAEPFDVASEIALRVCACSVS